MSLVLRNIIRFVLLVLMQVFVLDNIQFLGFINPMVYLLFILSLPIRLPRWAQLLLAFTIGIVIDIFSNTMGIHTFAAVFAAFVRQPVINLFVDSDEIARPEPTFSSFGVSAYIKYVAVIVILHHTALFLIEAFAFSNLVHLIPKIILSSAISILIILAVKSLFEFDK